jgi:hypothetical protein
MQLLLDIVLSQECGCVKVHLTWKSHIQNKNYPEEEKKRRRPADDTAL